MKVLGDDYPTSDGTCIRDYIDVNDLAEAHVMALRRLESGPDSFAVNLGTGQGHSVLQVLRTVEEVTRNPVRHVIGPRRPGDPPVLVADPAHAHDLLGWRATRNLHDTIATAWNWTQRSVNAWRTG